MLTFLLGTLFSFSLAAQLLHSFYTYAYIDESLELLSRTHFPLSLSTPKYIVKCLLLDGSSSFLLEEGKVTALPSLSCKGGTDRVSHSSEKQRVWLHEEVTCLRSVTSHIVMTSLQL